MVDEQIRARGIRNEAVLAAMARVPRHLFVPPEVRSRAYEDTPLPIGYGQTISQPYIVGYMTEALETSRDHRVLEIGTGSGYQAAVLAGLVRQVFSIEIVAELAESARRTLADAGNRNVEVRTGNGYLRLAGAGAVRPHHRDRGTTRDTTGADRSARGRWKDGHSGRHTPPGDRRRDQEHARCDGNAHDSRPVRADGGRPSIAASPLASAAIPSAA
jgi:hypothetical protein